MTTKPDTLEEARQFWGKHYGTGAEYADLIGCEFAVAFHRSETERLVREIRETAANHELQAEDDPEFEYGHHSRSRALWELAERIEGSCK
jgi:hypothetical protein